MTDEAYCFRETERSKKALARNARAKRNGSRSKYCSLPSDNLTEKERRKLNGEVITYNLDKPMDRETFRKLPVDVARKYLTRLATVYEARLSDVSDMFGFTNPGSMSNLSSALFGKGKSPFIAHTGRRMPSPRWIEFLNGVVEKEPEPAEVLPDAEVVEAVEDKPDANIQPFTLEDISLFAVGDPWFVFNKALLMLEQGKEYKISIRATVPKPNEALSNF